MRQQFEQNDVRVETQKTLAQINDLLLKIKKELTAINDVVCDNGHLNIAVKNANVLLSNVVRDLGIMEPENPDEERDESKNLTIPMTPDNVTEKMMAMIHNSEES